MNIILRILAKIAAAVTLTGYTILFMRNQAIVETSNENVWLLRGVYFIAVLSILFIEDATNLVTQKHAIKVVFMGMLLMISSIAVRVIWQYLAQSNDSFLTLLLSFINSFAILYFTLTIAFLRNKLRPEST
jgi:hypothetical protein